MTVRLTSLPDDKHKIADQRDVLIGEAFGQSVATALLEEQLGVMVEAPPRFDPRVMIERLNEASQYNIGLALVGLEEADINSLQSLSAKTDIRVTDELSDAIKWRNQTETEFNWGETAVPDRIVVFVRGDPPKLGSLHRLRSLPLGEARKTICKFMQERTEFEGNIPSERVWEALATGIEINLNIRAIAQYAISCLRPSRQESIDALGAELHELGLFVDPELLGEPSKIPTRLEENAKLVSRTIHLTNRDRKRLLNSIKTVDDEKRNSQAAFIERLRRFQRTNDDELLKELPFERVQSALETTSKRVTTSKSGQDEAAPSEDEASPSSKTSLKRNYSRRSDDDAVGVELSFEGKQEDLESLSEEFDEAFQKGVDENQKTVEFDYGDEQKLQVDIHSDLTHFLRRFVTADRYGGIIRGGDSREAIIANFTSMEVDYFTVDEEGGSFEKLRGFANRREEFESLVESLDQFMEARKQLVDALPSLIHSPIIRLLGDDDLLAEAQSYLNHYQQTQNKLDKKYIALQDASAQGARRLLSDFLLLDTMVLDTDQGRELLLSPLHPLHLWKYVQVATEVSENDETLTTEDKEFLQTSIEEQPHVLTSITAGGGRLLPEETYLIQSGEEGTLPVYTEPNRAEPGDNKYLWDYLTEKFVSAYPPSQRHLKITVVDPIQPHQLLTKVTTAAENGRLTGATVEFVYLNTDEQRLLAGATSNQEEAIINLFGPEGDTDAFSILTRECSDYQELNDHLESHQKHLTVINDQSSFFVEEFERDMDTAINPLYVPKEFDFDEFENEINISASAEGPLFSEYQTLINQLNNQRPKFHNAGVHELGVEKEHIEELLNDSIWVCLSAPSMNSNPFWEKDLISRERRGDREYAIYSEDIDLFTRTLRRILNEYPIAPDGTEIESIAERIATTERSGLLRLITEETFGSHHSRNSKGLLGSIIAVQWLEERYSDPKLIFSIDDPRTRNWLNFGDSNRRADFIILQQSEGGGMEMEIVEVKTLDEPDQAFTLEERDGEKQITGDAVDQLAETTNTIRRLFTEEDNITTPPRREALREQLYYELIGRETPGDKRGWVERINDVFRGDKQMQVNPHIVSVEINRQDAAEITQEGWTEDRQEIRVTRLSKKTILRLLMNGREEFTAESAPELEAQSAANAAIEPDQSTETSEVESAENTDSERPNPRQETSEEDSDEKTGEDVEETDIPIPESSTETDNTFHRPTQFGDPAEYADQVEALKRVLHDFGIKIDSIDLDQVEVGPNLVRFKVDLARGQKQGPLESRTEDIARELALEREPFIHRLPGTSYVAVDVPRDEPATVPIQNYLDLLPDQDEIPLGELPFVAGITPSGEAHTAHLNEAPHMLVGGTTGSGKTVFLYSLLTCLLDRLGASDLRLAIIDPKMTNFMFCNQLPNLEHNSVITESEATADLFEWIVEDEIPRRMNALGKSGSVDIGEHNERSDEPIKPFVVIIDEYADLIDGLGAESGEFEKNVRRIAQKARSLGIHLVISTQRPSAKIIDTDLRANLDMRVALRLPSASDSQVILDKSGAEDLGGNGDLLFREVDSLTRLQGAYVDTSYLRELIEKVSGQ